MNSLIPERKIAASAVACSGRSAKMRDLESKLSALVSADIYEADTTMMYDLVESLEAEPNPFVSIETILRFFETHSDTFFGAPGPLVHFMEKFYRHGYEEVLCGSFLHRPTRQTAFMLNRLINGSSGAQKEEYIQMLDRALLRNDIDQSTSEEISRFRSLHNQ